MHWSWILFYVAMFLIAFISAGVVRNLRKLLRSYEKDAKMLHKVLETLVRKGLITQDDLKIDE